MLQNWKEEYDVGFLLTRRRFYRDQPKVNELLYSKNFMIISPCDICINFPAISLFCKKYKIFASDGRENIIRCLSKEQYVQKATLSVSFKV